MTNGKPAVQPIAEMHAPSRHSLDGSVSAVLDQAEASRFRDGDPDAVRALYRAYGGLIYAVAYKILGDRGLAEEAAQQTFVQAWRTAGDVDLTRELGPWLAVIARRAATDLLRR